jgi:hypothetical protein
MTDIDQAERLRRLQQRSAAAKAAKQPGANRDAPATSKPRRRHPAAATRTMLAGLSVASFLTIGGGLLATQNATTTIAASPSNVAGQVVATPASATTSATTATPATPTTSASSSSTTTKQAAPVVHTKTRAS